MTDDPYLFQVVDMPHPVDGDTFDLSLSKVYELPFYLTEAKRWTARFRLLGIDTVERFTQLGPSAKSFATTWIDNAIADGVLLGRTHKPQPGQTLPDGQFGRWLIDLWRSDTGERLADKLAGAGYAK